MKKITKTQTSTIAALLAGFSVALMSGCGPTNPDSDVIAAAENAGIIQHPGTPTATGTLAGAWIRDVNQANAGCTGAKVAKFSGLGFSINPDGKSGNLLIGYTSGAETTIPITISYASASQAQNQVVATVTPNLQGAIDKNNKSITPPALTAAGQTTFTLTFSTPVGTTNGSTLSLTSSYDVLCDAPSASVAYNLILKDE